MSFSKSIFSLSSSCLGVGCGAFVEFEGFAGSEVGGASDGDDDVEVGAEVDVNVQVEVKVDLLFSLSAPFAAFF